MAKASILFEDTDEGVFMTLEFEERLPEDPADATDAQAQAIVAFRAYLSWIEDDYEPENDGEALPEV